MTYIPIQRTVKLDMPISVEAMHGMTFTNESGAHRFVITCTQNGENTPLSGGVIARFLRSDGNTVLLGTGATGERAGMAGIDENGDAVVTLHSDCYNVPGRFQLVIFNTSGTAITAIYAVSGVVQRTSAGKIIDSGNVIPNIEQIANKMIELGDLMDDAESAKEAAESAAETATAAAQQVGDALSYIAPEYNSSTAYAEGNYVTYGKKVYKAKSATTGNAPTNTTYWEETTIIGMASDAVTKETDALVGGMTVTASEVTGDPTAEIEKVNGRYNIAFGIPKGATGEQGPAGLGIKEVATQYYLSTSLSGLENGYWSDTVPQYETDKYYWSRTATTMTDDSVQYSAAQIDNALNDMYASIASVDNVNAALDTKIDGWFIENDTLYLTANGVVVGGGITGIGGGGGGGGGSTNDAVFTMTNGMDWLSKTVRQGADVSVTVNWSSLIDNTPTGIGTMKVIVNNAIRATLNVNQGNVTVGVGEYLTAGSNSIRITVSDLYGNSRSLVYTINSIAISVASPFDSSTVYTNAFSFPYVPVGSVEKTVHISLDGQEVPTFTTSVSNRQLSYLVPEQTHGMHSIEVWFTATIDNQTVESNHVYFEYIYAVEGESTPIIASDFNLSTINQYSTVSIPYHVYDPSTQQVEVKIYEGEELKTTLTIGREKQTYTYRAINSGNQNVTFEVGSVRKTISFSITPVNIDVEAETDGLQLYLSSNGRNNAEANPGTWVSGDVEAIFSNFNWTSDGWQRDNDGVTVMRVNGNARLTIPYKIFADDFRATGRTIEIEFATKDVRNYDTSVISCTSGWRGFQINPQGVVFASEQSTVATQFKDNEHVRLSFVVQKRSEQRLILVYINGIVSGVVQYPDNDDFSQVLPVDINIGGNDATVDIYAIRVYDHDLTRHQILSNWIADTQDGIAMVSRFEHNDIFDEYGNIVIEKLPNDLPYMVINGDLPTFKGNKLTVSGEYVDPLNSSKSFTFEDATIDVQGTSSQYYARKNYKIKFGGGFTRGGVTSSKYAMNDDAIPTKTFTFKADVASSEGANNVELARLYNDVCPYRTPYQKANKKVRQGIDGFPIVIFHNDGTEITFLGKYNFNNDKGTEEVFGFSEGDESWEIKNNTSNRVLWKSADYSGTAWLQDFEARYPDTDPPYTNSTNLAAFAAWLVSTDREQASGNILPQSVTYTDGETTTTYTNDNAAYRLAKFKHEIGDWAELDSLMFYYLFTELFLMVDSRAKNAFPSRLGGDKWCILPYDFDTALGINNEGALAFSYNLEDTDTDEGGKDVFNGQYSVLWVNLRDAFVAELKSMYQTIRSNGDISYQKVEAMFEAHQNKWPEAIFNEDAQYKYLDPLIHDNDAAYLGMLQGSKAEQRKWWMYNRFRYIDSKYNAGDALTDIITLRGYSKADITVTPYADIYPAVRYGSYLVTARGTRNMPMTLVNPMDNLNDTEIYVYSCSQLSSIGDISGLKVGYANFAKAIKLQQLKIGDSSSTYSNGNLEELYLGNNTLLKTIDVRNCPSLTMPVDLSGCVALEDVYFDGTSVAGVSLPNGGVIKTLHLPGTISNLTVLNQTQVTDFTCPDYSNVTTLRLENVSDAFDTFAIIDSMVSGGRVRLYNFHWEFDTLDELIELYDKLDTMRGLDQNDNNMQTAQLYGTVHVPSVTGAELALLGNRYPDVRVTYDSLTSNLYYYDFYGNTLLHTDTISNGGNGSWNGTPSTPSNNAQYTFGSFQGWSLNKQSATADTNALRNVTADRNVYAAFTATVRTYTATFKLDSTHGNTTLYTQNNVPYGTVPTYSGETPVSSLGEDYVWNGWSPELIGITGNTTYYATFRDMAIPLYKYLKRTITEYESNSVNAIGKYAFAYMNTLETVKVSASSIGEYAFNNCTALTEVDLTTTGSVSIGTYAFYNCSALKRVIIRSASVASLRNYIAFNAIGRALIYVPDSLVSTYKSTSPWNNSAIVNRIYGISDMYVYEWPEYEIEDDDAALFAAIADGTAHNKYKVGQYRTLDLGDEGHIRFQIAGFNMRELANSTDTAEIEWVAMDTLKTAHCMNPALSNNEVGTGTIGGFDKSEMKTYLDETILPLFPASWRNAIKETKIVSCTFDENANINQNEITNAKLRIPSHREVRNSSAQETTGIVYNDLFINDLSRVRYNNGTSVSWWLRSASSNTNFKNVTSNGGDGGSSSMNVDYIILSFST